MNDSFTPAPLVSDQPVGSFVEGDLAPPETSAWSQFQLTPTLSRVGRAVGAASATFGDIDEYGEQITQPEPPISQPEFEAKYSIPGKLAWDGPKPDGVYKSVYDTKVDELKREDAAQRRPDGLISGAANLGVGVVSDALDPLFLGSLIIPGAPEIELGEGLAARTGARVLEGAIGGAAQTAPLVGVNYALAKQEQADYSGASALADIAIGAGLGSALHVGLGAIGDYLDQRVAGSRYGRTLYRDPEARAAAFRTGMGQALNDDPVEVGPIFDAAAYEPGGEAPYPADQPIPPNAPGWPPPYITDAVHPDELTPGAEPFVRETQEPQRLASYLVAGGGVRDPGGDVLQTMGGWKGRPGLVSGGGRTLEDAALNAWQDGFFPNHSERPSVNDLLDAIDEDLKGNPQYSHHNEAALANYQAARAANGEVLRLSSELGISTTNITREQFFDAVAQHLSPEDFDARVGAEGERADDLYQEAERQASAWVAHHGTPHTFDRFDTAHLGTGEGAQAFGHGLYFAENPEVAASYQSALSVGSDAVTEAQEEFARTYEVLQRSIEGDRATYEAAKAAHEIAAANLVKVRAENAGNLYTVRINAEPHETLDWDKPLAEQPAEVQAAFRHAGFTEKEIAFGKLTGGQAYAEMSARLAGAREEPAAGWGAVAGGAAWSDRAEDAAAAARTLREAGVKGIRYLDAASRRDPNLTDKGMEQFFKPGEIVTYPTGRDRVISYNPPDAEHRWSVRVQEIDREGNPKGPVRDHATRPDARDVELTERARGETFDKDQTRNVVVFDHNDVEITHRNGEPVEPHKPTEPELHELQAGQEPHGGFDAEHFYGADQGRSLEDLENAYRQEVAAAEARERAGGVEPGTATAGDQGAVQAGGGPDGRGAGAAGRENPEDRSAAFDAALRRAGGQRDASPDDAAAVAAAKLRPEGELKQAQAQLESDMEFFTRADQMGELTDDVRAELESLGEVDKQAAAETDGAAQAAVCVIRGLAGGAA